MVNLHFLSFPLLFIYINNQTLHAAVVLTNDFVPLVDVVSPWEEHSATDHLTHDAAH